MPLSDESAVKITTGLYYSPAGHVVQTQGVKPDIEALELVTPNTALLDIRESDYMNALPTHTKNQPAEKTSTMDADIIRQFGFEVYQAYQTLLDQQRQLKCR